MKAVLLASAIAATPTSGAWHIDVSRYFATPAVEQSTRIHLLERVETFVTTPESSVRGPRALSAWLADYDSLTKALDRHDIYVYVLSEENVNDQADAMADSTLGNAMDRLDGAVARMLAGIGAGTLNAEMVNDKTLDRYRFFITSSLAQSAHSSKDAKAEALLAVPALNSLARSYKRLRPKPAKPYSDVRTDKAAKAAFEAQWAPFAAREQAIAAILIPIIHLQNGIAELHGFSGAPERAYFNAGLSAALVNRTLDAVHASNSFKRFETIVARQAARRLHIPEDKVRAWDLTLADSYRPAPTPFGETVRDVLAAVKPMGPAYAGQYDALFAPQNHRVEWCRARTCDPAGFSVGFAGSTSGLFYGAYRGTTDNIRAVAHEAGHAVHRQFMNENQPLAVYNEGPHFLFESFAIFNGFILERYLYQHGVTPAQKAFYLHRFIRDATFNVFGSARQTDLEQSIYTGVIKGAINNAADLDKLTLEVFARYMPPVALGKALKDDWARDTLYYTDPLYDVNYLFAGLLALNYLHRYQKDPTRFSRRYVAILKNGFTDTPQAMLKRFLSIDMDNVSSLVKTATDEIDQLSSKLDKLYGDTARKR